MDFSSDSVKLKVSEFLRNFSPSLRRQRRLKKPSQEFQFKVDDDDAIQRLQLSSHLAIVLKKSMERR